MEYRVLGRAGVIVSPICLGSDDFGDAKPPDVAKRREYITVKDNRVNRDGMDTLIDIESLQFSNRKVIL